jgi:hypothetical protein
MATAMEPETPGLRRRGIGLLGAALGLGVGLLTLGPALRRGYVLSYDMVFVPHQPITAAVLGTDGAVPRAVPNDLVVALASAVLPADLVQKALLLGVFVLGGWGVARLVPRGPATAVAVLAYTWNAYVFERLVIGHWGFLLGYAALPWVVAAATAVRAARPGALAVLALTVSLAGLAGSTSLVIAGPVALGVLLAPGPVPRRWRGTAVTAAATLLAACSWLVPALSRAGGLDSDPRAVAAFATSADTPLGVLGSALTLGGVWNPAVWPAERSSLLLSLVSLLAVGAAVAWGAPPFVRAFGGTALAVFGLAVLGTGVALAGATPGLSGLLEHVVTDVPGGGLLRDGQKFLSPLSLAVALCAGHAVARLGPNLRGVAWPLAILPIALLPSLAWGAHGRLAPATYPAEWSQLRVAVGTEQARSPGDVLVLPYTLYRRFDWNGRRTLLDPAPRWLDDGVVVNDDLPLSSVTVRGEDVRAARIRTALASGGDLAPVLARESISLVLVERDQPDPAGQRDRVSALPVLWQGKDLELRGGPPGGQQPRASKAPVGVVLSAVGLAGALAATVTTLARRRWYARPT